MTAHASGAVPVLQELIPLTARDDWERALHGLPHAFAHTWASCSAMSLTTGWPTYLYVWQRGGSRAVCAISERGSPGVVDVVTPYGFGGFVATSPGSDVLAHWGAFARARGYVSGYLGLNPLFMPPDLRGSPDYAEHNELFVLPLEGGTDALYDSLSTNRRRELRSFAARGAQVVDDRTSVREYFLAGFDDFMRSKGATSTYDFSDETWRALLDCDEVFLLGAQEADGSLVAASLFALTPYCGEYLFGISDPGRMGYSSNLIWAAATRLADEGVPLLNLGGGVHPGDGVAAFKARFGGRRLPLGALRQVYQPDTFARLCRQVGRDPWDRTGFFPPYRALQVGASTPTTIPGSGGS